jgi:hypothetical protein
VLKHRTFKILAMGTTKTGAAIRCTRSILLPVHKTLLLDYTRLWFLKTVLAIGADAAFKVGGRTAAPAATAATGSISRTSSFVKGSFSTVAGIRVADCGTPDV